MAKLVMIPHDGGYCFTQSDSTDRISFPSFVRAVKKVANHHGGRLSRFNEQPVYVFSDVAAAKMAMLDELPFVDIEIVIR